MMLSRFPLWTRCALAGVLLPAACWHLAPLQQGLSLGIPKVCGHHSLSLLLQTCDLVT